jgi:hypothetical protein
LRRNPGGTNSPFSLREKGVGGLRVYLSGRHDLEVRLSATR